MAVMNLREAIRKGFHDILERDPSTFLIGVGITDKSAVFGTLEGLYDKFGDTRLIEAPLSESMLTGLILGAALNGMKPVLIHSRINFSFLGMDQIVNHIALWKDMFSLKHDLPIMIRGVAGQEGWGNGAQHLGTHYDIFKNIKGIKTTLPLTPHEGYTEITSWCFFDKSPTIFIDQKEHYEKYEDMP